MCPSDIRQAVSEWAAMGFAVTLDTRAGVITIMPLGPQQSADPFDQVDMRA
tara:strand:+ start:6938 stop:7090 length:153 start_codon:yes stop_codon:yes gene_type:complete